VVKRLRARRSSTRSERMLVIDWSEQHQNLHSWWPDPKPQLPSPSFQAHVRAAVFIPQQHSISPELPRLIYASPISPMSPWSILGAFVTCPWSGHSPYCSARVLYRMRLRFRYRFVIPQMRVRGSNMLDLKWRSRRVPKPIPMLRQF
jgi:hypothetical protein